MHYKDNGTKRVAIVGQDGIDGSMRAALTLLATTQCWDFEIVDCNEQLKAYAIATRSAEKEIECLKRYHLHMLEAAKASEEAKANLNYEEIQKLKTRGSRSKQRRKW